MSTTADQIWRWKRRVIVAALIVCVASVGWLGGALWEHRETARAVPRDELPAPATYTIRWVDAATLPAREKAPSSAQAPASAMRAASVGQPPMVELGTPAWEQHVAAVLADTEHTDSVKAQTLLALLPVLPEELLQETTQAAIDRLRDEDYLPAALPLLLNAQTHGVIAGVLFTDLLERPDSIALPALLVVARTPAHPFASVAHADLELLLGTDHGENWPAWEAEARRRVEPAQK